MSGGPPHHPHNRLPAGNTAWNHLQVPFFPRQPQLAHMSNEHPMMHQPTWHTPTTEPMKAPHSHIINLEQMLSERPYLRQAPGVDLTLARNTHNGDMPAAPISLSVRDTNKINSLAASALERQGELTKSASPKPASPPVAAKTKSPTPDKQLSPKIKKVKRVDSILERLNPLLADGEVTPTATPIITTSTGTGAANPTIVAAPATNSSHDENSNSSSILNVPTPREEDVVSPYSNEDSLDSNKSRRSRKRKPAKTMKVTKEAEVPPTPETLDSALTDTATTHVNQKRVSSTQPTNPNPSSTTPTITENVQPANEVETVVEHAELRKDSPIGQDSPRKTRRKNSSDDETIDKIAAMVDDLVSKPHEDETSSPNATATVPTTSATPSATITPMVTLAQKKDFIAVEDKLEEMFAGLEDGGLEDLRDRPMDGPRSLGSITDLLTLTPSTSQEKVSSTSNLDVTRKKPLRKKRKLKGKQLNENASSKKKKAGGLKTTKKQTSSKKMNGKAKFDTAKDVYAYDSGSNASSSKSRGPFVHISGPRDSPLSVSVINTPANDEDGDSKKSTKSKKFHDDGDFRHKVRSKGLHSSTLSNKYDAQTKDASWICAFCKRGPYTGEFSDNDTHYMPGDLFGPYAITSECSEYKRRLHDPYDKSFKSKKISRCLDAAASAGKPNKRGPKRKISSGADVAAQEAAQDVELGIARLEDATYEVWAHEDCIVWSPGVYLVGAKIVGLEEAVWTASNVACARCANKGANICCLKRGCTNVMHLGCAYLAHWKLDDENYKSFCSEHAV